MLYFTVCVLALLAATGVHGRYLYASTIHGSIETNKIISNWEDALAQCESEGAVLAAPISDQLRIEMIDLISVNNHSTPYFINAKIVHSQKLQFVSSEGVSLDDMSVSDMIDELDPREGDCLAMDAHTIRIVSCSMPLPYMCYRKDYSITSTTTESVIVETTTELVIVETTTEQDINPCGTTDAEYRLDPLTGSCYKFHPEARFWDVANLVCIAEGGYLAIPNDEHEADYIHILSPVVAFIGLRDFNETGVWTSVRGDSIDQLYNVWHFDHKPHSPLNCAAINSNGTLNALSCVIVAPFVCEKDPQTESTTVKNITVPVRSITETTSVPKTDKDIICGSSDDDGYIQNPTTRSCYKYHDEASNWDVANSVCTAEGGYLTIINDEKEAKVIQDMNHAGAWVGLRDYNDNNVWISVKGDSIDQLYDVWHDFHIPYPGLNCATLDSNGFLDDYYCENEKSFICEKESCTKQTVAVTEPEPFVTTCGTFDTDYKLNTTTCSCYKYHDERVKWDDANAVCNSEGGYLTIVNDQQEANVLHDMGYVEAYIGLRDYNGSDVWISVQGDSIDNLYNKWHIGHNPFSTSDCAVLDDFGLLNDYSCESKKAFICEKTPRKVHLLTVDTPITVSPIIETSTIPVCDSDEGYRFNNVTSRCYNYHNKRKTWDDANSACTAEGGYLAIINDEQEANAIRDMGYAGAYIGLRDYDDNNTWTSVHGDSIEQLFSEWHEGHKPYTRWNCAVVNDRGKLYDDDCESIKSFLCEKDPRRNSGYDAAIPQTVSTFTETATQPVTSADNSECGTSDKDYKLDTTTGSCYKFHGEYETWYDANTTCVAEGGYLAVINNELEAQAIRAKKYPTLGFGVFIGLRNIKDGLGWTSVTGVSLAQLYHKWHWGHYYTTIPSYRVECAMIIDSGLLVDQNCYTFRPFLCEKDPRRQSNAFNNNA